jgi:membrane associated rhomboid family serine protease
VLERFDARTHMRYYSIYIVVGLLSITLAWLGVGMAIGLPGWIYALLGPICYANGATRDRARRRLELSLTGEPPASSPAVAV